MTERDALQTLLACDSMGIGEALRTAEEMLDRKILADHHITISECKDGYYTGHYTDIVTGRRRQIRRKSKRDLERELALRCGGGSSTYSEATMRDIFDRWMAARLEAGSLAEATVIRNRRLFKQYLAGGLGDQCILDVTTGDIAGLLLDVRRAGATAKAFSNLRGLLRGIYQEAAALSLRPPCDIEEACVRVAAVMGRSFAQHAKADGETVFSPGEVQTLSEYLWTRAVQTHKLHYAGLLFSLLTGLRVGELAVLRWSDLTPDCDGIAVTSTETESLSGKRAGERTKTPAGQRVIPVPSEAVRVLDLARSHGNGGEWIFTYTERGHTDRIKAEKFRRALKRACLACGIEYRPPHATRRTYATTMREAGVEDQTLERLMGHTSIGITEAFYIKDRAELADRRAVVDSALAKAHGKNKAPGT